MKNAVDLAQRPGREPRRQFRWIDEFRVSQSDEIGAFFALRRKIRNHHLRAAPPVEFPDQHAADESSAARHEDALVLPIFFRQGHRVIQGCHGAAIEAI